MSSNIYLDFKGKEIKKDDRVHYATKNGICIGWVIETLGGNEGIKVIGVGKKRACIVKSTEEKVIVDITGYYIGHKRANRTGRA